MRFFVPFLLVAAACQAGDIGSSSNNLNDPTPAPTAQAPVAEPPSSEQPPPPPEAAAPDIASLPHAHCGYLGYSDARGLATFTANAAFFDVIHPDWYSIDADGVHIVPYRGANDQRVFDVAQKNGVRVIPLIAGVDDVVRIEKMLDSDDLRAQHIAEIVKASTKYHYDGIEIDYEHLPATYRDKLTSFYADLAAAMHAQGLEASAAVGGDFNDVGPYDYASASAVLDHLHIMGYDFHWVASHHGPLAPLGWSKAVVQNAVATGRPKKFIFAVGNYAITPGSFCTTVDCMSLCTGNFQTVTTELDSCSFNQTDHFEGGRQPNCAVAGGTMWYEDAASIEEKIVVAQKAGLGGIGYWTVGGEPDGWFSAIKMHF